MEHTEFNFTCPATEDIDPLQADWESMEDRASKVWTIPLRKKARFKLKGILKEFEGVIRVARRPTVWDSHRPLELRMDNMTFTNLEIEQFSVLD